METSRVAIRRKPTKKHWRLYTTFPPCRYHYYFWSLSIQKPKYCLKLQLQLGMEMLKIISQF